MTIKNKTTGFAIAIAWPETWCKQSGGWYEWITSGLGISKNNYYRAGHAALVLVDRSEERCFYFDFGRYRSPFDHGRVRGEMTDPDLTVHTRPVFSANGKEMLNFSEILTELQQNPSCHGDGRLHASYAPVHFEKAYSKALEMQAQSPLPYGPFRYKGSNCSRFVNTVLLAGKPNWKQYFKLNFMVPLTPTPLNNVHAFGHQVIIENLSGKQPACPTFIPDKKYLKSTLPPPERHPYIPENAQWLAGEGAGSWFHVEPHNKGVSVSRYSPEGKIEFNRSFFSKILSDQTIALNEWRIAYPCDAQVMTFRFKNQLFHLKQLWAQKAGFSNRQQVLTSSQVMVKS
ncbi:MAG: hypothetical protein JXR22_13605 [Prolixibacteraceae bacterium]|nr:hypothetical protein [Prolixibacteraceae bacterium]